MKLDGYWNYLVVTSFEKASVTTARIEMFAAYNENKGVPSAQFDKAATLQAAMTAMRNHKKSGFLSEKTGHVFIQNPASLLTFFGLQPETRRLAEVDHLEDLSEKELRNATLTLVLETKNLLGGEKIAKVNLGSVMLPPVHSAHAAPAGKDPEANDEAQSTVSSFLYPEFMQAASGENTEEKHAGRMGSTGMGTGTSAPREAGMETGIVGKPRPVVAFQATRPKESLEASIRDGIRPDGLPFGMDVYRPVAPAGPALN